MEDPVNESKINKEDYIMLLFVLMNLNLSVVMAVLTIKFIRQTIQVNDNIMVHIFTDINYCSLNARVIGGTLRALTTYSFLIARNVTVYM